MSETNDPNSRNLAERLSVLEDALRFDERLSTLEQSARFQNTAKPPWWRDVGTIRLVAILIAAVVPLVTAINGYLQNKRESDRIKIDQQDRIRQVYLDRALKPGITEGEAHQVFGLLRKLKNDPEMAQWADEQFKTTEQNINDLRQAKDVLEKKLQDVITTVRTEADKNSKVEGKRVDYERKVRELQAQATSAEQQLAEINRRIGDPGFLSKQGGTSYPVIGSSADLASYLSGPPPVVTEVTVRRVSNGAELVVHGRNIGGLYDDYWVDAERVVQFLDTNHLGPSDGITLGKSGGGLALAAGPHTLTIYHSNSYGSLSLKNSVNFEFTAP
jgi:hypothetical protein